MPLRIGYLFTTFPKYSETFLMREVDAMATFEDVQLALFSCFGGSGKTYRRFPLAHLRWWHWCLLPLRALVEGTRRPSLSWRGCALYLKNPPTSWTNAGEQILGIALALTYAARLRRQPVDTFHAVWATAPTTAALLLRQLTGIPFSMGAHAYDIYRNGGDCLLSHKLNRAKWVHTTSHGAARTLESRGAEASKIKMIRRGLNEIPKNLKLRPIQSPVHFLSVGRLIGKKGYFEQLKIYQHLHAAGLPFQVRIIGEGPLYKSMQEAIREMGLVEHIELLGRLPYTATKLHYAWADFFVFTGKVAEDGDRDGLPNVIGEAMAEGVAVLSTAVAATPEVILSGQTGELLPIDHAPAWQAAVERLIQDKTYSDELRRQAHAWVTTEFDAAKNARRLLEFHKTFFTA